MTIMQLKYFLAICEYGKIRITAERLFVSEAAVSSSLKRLEEELGSPLFTRDRKRLILTEDGQYLRDRAPEIVSAFDHLELEMRQRRLRHPAVLSIGIPSSLSEYVFSPLFSEFMEMDPSLQFDFVPGASQEQIRRVEEGQLELAICDHTEVVDRNLEFIPLLRSEMLGCVYPGHVLATRERVTAAELSGEKLLAVHESATTTKEIRRWFSAQEYEANIFMYSNKISFTLSLLKRHNAVTFFLDGMFFGNQQIQQEALCSFSLDPPLYIINGIARRKGRKLSKEAQRFFDFCIGKRID